VVCSRAEFYRHSCLISVDELLHKSSKSGYGCHGGNTFFGCIMYADDLILLSPSLCGLQYMIVICSDYATDHSLVFNATKTVCTIVNKLKCLISAVSMDNNEIKFTNHFKYLGVHFTGGSDISVDIVPVRHICFIACNSIIARVMGLLNQSVYSLSNRIVCLCLSVALVL